MEEEAEEVNYGDRNSELSHSIYVCSFSLYPAELARDGKEFFFYFSGNGKELERKEERKDNKKVSQILRGLFPIPPFIHFIYRD